MAKDNAMTIGSLVGHTGVRDAIHVPIISVTAGEDLLPGAHVHLNDALEAFPSSPYGSIGVIDPYLSAVRVAKGTRVWLLVKPGSISTLTHQWTHKALPATEAVVPEKEKARVRLEEWAEKELSVSLEEMLNAIEACRRGGDPLYSHGYEGVGEYEGFWDDYVLYTEKEDPNKASGYFYFFTCGGCS